MTSDRHIQAPNPAVGIGPWPWVVCGIGIGCLLGALAWRFAPRPERPMQSLSTPATPDEGSPRNGEPAVELPVVSAPVSPGLRATADISLPADVRLRPLVDGSVAEIQSGPDVTLIRRILLDVREGDTLRNEAANLLHRSGVPGLAADLRTVLANPAERERFRSFAAQHLGIVWLAGDGSDDALRGALRGLLDDRHTAVRREALLALSRGGEAAVGAQIEAILETPAGDDDMRDLACRIAADRGRDDLLPAIRPLAGDAMTDPVVRAAALRSLVALGDPAAAGLCREAASSGDRQVAAAAAACLRVLEGGAAEMRRDER